MKPFHAAYPTQDKKGYSKAIITKHVNNVCRKGSQKNKSDSDFYKDIKDVNFIVEIFKNEVKLNTFLSVIIGILSL